MKPLPCITEEYFGEVETVSCMRTDDGFLCHIHQHREEVPETVECTHLEIEYATDLLSNKKHLKFDLDKELIELVQLQNSEARVLVFRNVGND